MKTLMNIGVAAALLCGTVAAAPAAFASDTQNTVDHAAVTLQDLRGDKEFGNARSLLHKARAVIIAPRIFKAGFFFGGEGGNAVLMVRGRHGWSDPAFYTIASASFGLQIGAQESEMVMFIMSDRALNAVMRNKFKIGADAGIAVATLGGEVGGSTTTNVGADIIYWATSAGAYAGLTLNGSVIAPNGDADAQYYGRAVTSSGITIRRSVSSPGAKPLVQLLDNLG